STSAPHRRTPSTRLPGAATKGMRARKGSSEVVERRRAAERRVRSTRATAAWKKELVVTVATPPARTTPASRPPTAGDGPFPPRRRKRPRPRADRRETSAQLRPMEASKRSHVPSVAKTIAAAHSARTELIAPPPRWRLPPAGRGGRRSGAHGPGTPKPPRKDRRGR